MATRFDLSHFWERWQPDAGETLSAHSVEKLPDLVRVKFLAIVEMIARDLDDPPIDFMMGVVIGEAAFIASPLRDERDFDPHTIPALSPTSSMDLVRNLHKISVSGHNDDHVTLVGERRRHGVEGKRDVDALLTRSSPSLHFRRVRIARIIEPRRRQIGIDPPFPVVAKRSFGNRNAGLADQRMAPTHKVEHRLVLSRVVYSRVVVRADQLPVAREFSGEQQRMHPALKTAVQTFEEVLAIDEYADTFSHRVSVVASTNMSDRAG